MAGDAVRTAGADDDVRLQPLEAAVGVHQFDLAAAGIRIQGRSSDAAFDAATQRDQALFQDALGQVLRQAAYEAVAAVQAIEAQRLQRGQFRAVQPKAVHRR